MVFFFFSSRRRHTRSYGDWSSDVCSSDLPLQPARDLALGIRAPFAQPLLELAHRRRHHEDQHGVGIARAQLQGALGVDVQQHVAAGLERSEEHTSELQSPYDLVCRLLLEKKNPQGLLS